MSIALAFRALKGGAATAAVALDAGQPRLLLSTFLATHGEGDRLSLEPYAVAFEMPRGPAGEASAEAEAAVAEGRKRQEAIAARALEAVVAQLQATGHRPSVAGLLVNRTGWITDALSYSLAWPEHVPIAEGLAVRDALRAGCGMLQLPIEDVDEKSLADTAAIDLELPADAIDARLKEMGTIAGKPWRKEQKLAALAAWSLAALAND